MNIEEPLPDLKLIIPVLTKFKVSLKPCKGTFWQH